MKLYGAIASPYVTRVLMFARLKGVDLELLDPPGGSRSDEYRAMTPIGKIPSLEADGHIIPESETICEYIEDVHPEPSGLPADAQGRATSRTISRITDLYLAPHVSTIVPHINPANRDADVVEKVGGEIAKGFVYLEHFMGPGPFAVSDQPTLGDCSAGPYLMLMRKLVFDHFDDIADPTQTPGRLADWWQALEGHEVCASTINEYATAVDGFLKYLLKR